MISSNKCSIILIFSILQKKHLTVSLRYLLYAWSWFLYNLLFFQNMLFFEYIDREKWARIYRYISINIRIYSTYFVAVFFYDQARSIIISYIFYGQVRLMIFDPASISRWYFILVSVYFLERGTLVNIQSRFNFAMEY